MFVRFLIFPSLTSLATQSHAGVASIILAIWANEAVSGTCLVSNDLGTTRNVEADDCFQFDGLNWIATSI